MRIVLAALALAGFATPGAATVYYVDEEATGLSDGSTWTDAYVDLQDAFGIASSGDEIWVASGVYQPTSDLDRTISFRIPDGVDLYGGFAGTESASDERIPGMHPTILSGDIGEPVPPTPSLLRNVPRPNSAAPPSSHRAWFDARASDVLNAWSMRSVADNSFSVVVAESLSESSVIDGFEITRGRDGGGGGLRCNAADLLIRDVRFTLNSTTGTGGGAYLFGGSNVTFEDVLFSNNSASYTGGALGIDGAGNVVLRDVHFVDNFGGVNGGGVWCASALSISITGGSFQENASDDTTGGISCYVPIELRGVRFESNDSYWGSGAARLTGSSTVIDCMFLGNESVEPSNVGAAALYSSGPLLVINSLFVGNKVLTNYDLSFLHHAGAIYSSSDLVVINTCFFDNAANRAGALLSTYTGPSEIRNSILWANRGDHGDDSLVLSEPDSVVVSHSIVQGASGGWPVGYGLDLGGNLDVDPDFIDALGEDLRLMHDSPAVNAGDDSAVPPGIELDLGGNPRFMGGNVDMGPFETPGALSVIDPPAATVPGLRLYAAPNPFNPGTTIYFSVPRSGRVDLSIYDLAGRKVRSLITGYRSKGDHEMPWNGLDSTGRRVASGVYLYQLRGDGFLRTKRLTLVK